MKWVALIVVLAATIYLSGRLRSDPRAASKVLIFMGFLPFLLAPFHLYMALISLPWSGYVQGFEFSVLDAVALAVYLGLPGTRPTLPFKVSMGLYFLAALLSVLQAPVPMAALFYPWQLARMFLVYAAVARACTDPRGAPALLQGMAVGLFMEAGVTIWQRFGLGMLQTPGTLGHQNLLGLLTHLIVFPFFALLLAGRRGWLPAAVPLAGAVIEVLTTSRATIGFAGMGYAAVFMLSALRRWTSRKALVLSVAVAIVTVLTPLALLSIERRGAAELESSDDERVAFETAAAMMLTDHPFGIGANNYVLVANTGGYNAKAGVVPVFGSESAHVHNVYWLVAAETGYPGLVTFVLLLLCPMAVALHCSWRNRGDQRGDVLLGLGVALLTVYIHSMFEWVFITFQAQYMFALELGLVAGLAEQLGYWRRSDARRVQLAVGTLSLRPTRSTGSGLGRTSQTVVQSTGDRPNAPNNPTRR